MRMGWIYTQVSVGPYGVSKVVSSPLELELQAVANHPMSVLGPALRSSLRAIQTLNC